MVENVEKQNVDVDVNPEEVFCRKVGDALTAGVNFVEAAFETIEVSIKLFFYVSPHNGKALFQITIYDLFFFTVLFSTCFRLDTLVPIPV